MTACLVSIIAAAIISLLSLVGVYRARGEVERAQEDAVRWRRRALHAQDSSQEGTE